MDKAASVEGTEEAEYAQALAHALAHMRQCVYTLNVAIARLADFGIDVEIETYRLQDCANPGKASSAHVEVTAFIPKRVM